MAFDIIVADMNESRRKYFIISGVRVVPAIQLTANNAYVQNMIASIRLALPDEVEAVPDIDFLSFLL